MFLPSAGGVAICQGFAKIYPNLDLNYYQGPEFWHHTPPGNHPDPLAGGGTVDCEYPTVRLNLY